MFAKNFSQEVHACKNELIRADLVERLFLFVSFLLIAGLGFGGPEFAKQGIPLPIGASFGRIPNLQIKFFVFEIYLVFLLLLLVFSLFRRRAFVGWSSSPLVVLTVFLLVAGLARAAPDVLANPLLVVRSSSFVWYLLVPLLIFLLPLKRSSLEVFFKVVAVLFFVAFLASLIASILVPGRIPNFFTEAGGCFLFLAIGLLHGKRAIRIALLSIFSLAICLMFLGQVSRTGLVALACTGILSCFVALKAPRQIWAVLLRVAAMVVLSVFLVCLGARSMGGGYQSASHSLYRGEAKSVVVEAFRERMWVDAWKKFTASPFIGIGFLKPVVDRIYVGDGGFAVNDGSLIEGLPPISGPHNSYLNAISRMGIWGLGFLILHVWAGFLFWAREQPAPLFLMASQSIYALFNVGLEGPARSAVLLICLGYALKLSTETRERV